MQREYVFCPIPGDGRDLESYMYEHFSERLLIKVLKKTYVSTPLNKTL